MTAGNERSLLLNPNTVEEAAGANRTLLRDSYALRFAGERRENNTKPREKKGEKNPTALLKNQSQRDGGGLFSWPTVGVPLLSQGLRGKGEGEGGRAVASFRGITYLA